MRAPWCGSVTATLVSLPIVWLAWKQWPAKRWGDQSHSAARAVQFDWSQFLVARTPASRGNCCSTTSSLQNETRNLRGPWACRHPAMPPSRCIWHHQQLRVEFCPFCLPLLRKWRPTFAAGVAACTHGLGLRFPLHHAFRTVGYAISLGNLLGV